MQPPAMPSLRSFGLILAGFLALVFGTALPLLAGAPTAPVAWAAAAVTGTLALARPAWLAPVFTAWTALGRVLGWINTRLLLGAVFFALIWPVGALRRLGGAGVPKRADPAARSYRKSAGPRPADHFDQPF